MWLITKILIFPLLIYFIPYWVLSVIETKGPKLLPNEVRKLLKIERNILNLEKKPIRWHFLEEKKSITDLINGTYHIYFGKKAVRLTVKHELFHVYRESPKTFAQSNSKKVLIIFWTKIKYFFWYEFRAKLFTVCNLRL